MQQVRPESERKYVFKGKTVAEAMKKVRAKLGREAFIYEHRRVPRKSTLTGLLVGDEIVEIIAAASPPPPPPEAAAVDTEQRPLTLLQKTYCARQPRKTAAVADSSGVEVEISSTSGIAAQLEALACRLENGASIIEDMREEMRGLFALQGRGGLPAVGSGLMDTYRILVEAGVDDKLGRSLVETVQARSPGRTLARDAARRAVRAEAVRRARVAGPLVLREPGPTLMAVIGPSGVGKTTTITKLALEFSVHHNCRTGVVTDDLQRPGAVEQLRGLEHIIGLPVIRAETAERAREALSHFTELDLVLIDTAGRSPRDARGIAELAGYLQALKPHETHLVIACGSSRDLVQDSLQGFAPAGFDRVIVSKVDEVRRHGLLLDLATRDPGVLSYLTDGKDNMRSIHAVEREEAARLALGEDTDTEHEEGPGA